MTVDCESVCMATMAIADGYQPELSPREIEIHLASCLECRREVQEQQALSTLLDAHERRQRTENVWNQIGPRLPAASSTTSSSRVGRALLLLGVLLLAYRITEMIPDSSFGIGFKLVPIALVIAAFGYLKENPFKINTELRFEGGLHNVEA